MKSDRTWSGRTDMTHPWLDAQNISTLPVPASRNPYRCEGRIRASSDNLNLREDTIEDIHSTRCDEKCDKNDTVLPYAVIEKDANGHDSRGTRHYLYSRWQVSHRTTRKIGGGQT